MKKKFSIDNIDWGKVFKWFLITMGALIAMLSIKSVLNFFGYGNTNKKKGAKGTGLSQEGEDLAENMGISDSRMVALAEIAGVIQQALKISNSDFWPDGFIGVDGDTAFLEVKKIATGNEYQVVRTEFKSLTSGRELTTVLKSKLSSEQSNWISSIKHFW